MNSAVPSGYGRPASTSAWTTSRVNAASTWLWVSTPTRASPRLSAGTRLRSTFGLLSTLTHPGTITGPQPRWSFIRGPAASCGCGIARRRAARCQCAGRLLVAGAGVAPAGAACGDEVAGGRVALAQGAGDLGGGLPGGADAVGADHHPGVLAVL